VSLSGNAPGGLGGVRAGVPGAPEHRRSACSSMAAGAPRSRLRSCHGSASSGSAEAGARDLLDRAVGADSITPSQGKTCVIDVDPSPGGPRLPRAGPPWEDPGLAHQALQEPARPVLAYTPGVAEPCREIAAGRRRPIPTRPRGTSWPWSPTAPRCSAWATSERSREAGDGGQGDPLQGVRGHRRLRSGGGLGRSRRHDPILSAARADRRWDQPRRHPLPDCFYIEKTLRETLSIPVFTTTSTARRSSRVPHCSTRWSW